jgi:hypothetical protein
MYLKTKSMIILLECNKEKRQERSKELGEAEGLGVLDLPTIP